MNKHERTDQKSNKSITAPKRTIWAITLTCFLLLIGISSVLSSSQKNSSFTPISGWTTSSAPLPIEVAGKNAVAHDANGDGQDDFIFIVGGRVAAGLPTNLVHVGTIDEGGGITEWAAVTSLPQPLFLHSLDANDTHLFVIGGWKGSKPTQNLVYSAPIQADGTLGAWTTQADFYPQKVSQQGSVIAGDFIYGIGGWEGDFAHSSVYYATIGNNGSVTGWTATQQLPFAIRRAAAVTIDNRIYLTGGVDGNGDPLTSVYFATINTDGTLSAWTPTTALPQPMFYHRAVVHDGEIIVLGGKSEDDGDDLRVVYSASANSDGSLNGWASETPIPVGLFRFAAVSVMRWSSEYIFILGGGQGENGAPLLQDEVYYSDVPPTPTPTPTSTPTPTPTPPVSMDVSLSNSPSDWVAPGEEILYTITYRNNGPGTASNTEVKSRIPQNTELVTSSANPPESGLTTSGPGGEISWDLSNLPSGASGVIRYSVRRTVPVPNTSGAINVALTGPSSGTSQQPLTYTINVTNSVGSSIGTTTVMVNLPSNVTYLSSSQGGTLTNGDTITWAATGIPNGSWTLTFTLLSNSSFVLYDYEVRATVVGSDAIACCGTSQDVLVTTIDGGAISDDGDGVTIANDVSVTWNYANQPDSLDLLRVQNPKRADNELFLPLVSR